MSFSVCTEISILCLPYLQIRAANWAIPCTHRPPKVSTPSVPNLPFTTDWVVQRRTQLPGPTHFAASLTCPGWCCPPRQVLGTPDFLPQVLVHVPCWTPGLKL